LEELVFAIPTEQLWRFLFYKKQGLIHCTSDVLDIIIKTGLFRKRKELEEDPSFQQIIPYAIISCNEAGKQSFLLFKRTSGQREKRLHNMLHLGVGGHMNPSDSKEQDEQYLIDELKRELFEELRLENTCKIEGFEYIGLINDDTIPVSRLHIGLLYEIRVSSKDITVKETNKMTANWVTKADLATYYHDMETWSKIAIDYYIQYKDTPT
jgi:predicted NUDIX family phosphoesterase